MTILGHGGVGNLVCAADMALIFGDANSNTDWPRNNCFAVMTITAFVGGEDAAGAPKEFVLSSGAGHGVILGAPR